MIMQKRSGVSVFADRSPVFSWLGLIFLAVLVSVCLGGGTAWAEEDASSTDSSVERVDVAADPTHDGGIFQGVFGVFGDHVKLQLFDNQQLLGLPVNTASYYFKIPEETMLGAATLSLDIGSSDTLIDERSSISIDVNGNRIETVPIKSIGTDGNGTLTLDLPLEYLRVGEVNALTFTTAQRSIEGDCADMDNPSNWVAIEDSSFLDLKVTAFPPFDFSDAYDMLYDSMFSGLGLGARFMLSDEGNRYLLQSSALDLACAAGAYKTDARFVDFTTDADPEVSSPGGFVFVGWQDDWVGRFNAKVLNNLASGQGYLETAGGTSSSDAPRLLVAGSDADGLDRAVALASSPGYLEQVSGTSTIVTSDIPAAKPPELSENGVYTFEDLGYDTISLAGAFHQQTTYNVTQPNNMACGPASTVTINFSHSKALQADRSLLTVKIDDTEIDSIQLSDSNAVDGSITVAIPEEARDRATIKITVEVYNYIGKIDCSKDYYDVAWTVIQGSSSVFFDPSDLRLRPRLSDFLGFNLWKETPDSMVVLRSDGLSDTALDIAARVGQKNATSLDFDSASLGTPIRDVDKDNDAIYLGSVSNMQLPQEIEDALDVIPRSNGTFKVVDGVPFMNETLSGKVVIQVIRSPWNYDKYIYVIVYPDGQEYLAKDVIQDRDVLDALNGTISTVDSEGVVSSFDMFSGTEGEEAPLSLQTIQYKVYKQFGIPLWWLVGGVVLLILLVVLIIRLALRRSQFKKMEQKMKEANLEPPGGDGGYR